MLTYPRGIKGFKYLLTVIDILSKYAWSAPIKSTNEQDVTKLMKSILVQGQVPKNLHAHQSRKFYN